MFDLAKVQEAIRQQGLDGWLLYDFRGLNVLAKRVIQIPADVFLSSTTVDDRFVVRVCILSHRTHRDRVDEAIELIRSAV